jgi:hypothetical protein
MAAVRQKPTVKKRQLKHRHRNGQAMIKVGKQTADLIEAPETIHDWDDEELERGQRKAKDGTFRGRPPTIIPTECHNELTRRVFERANRLMRSNLEAAVEQLTRIAQSDFADDNAKLKAIDMMMNRVLGKVPEKVDLKHEVAEPEWLKAMKEATIVGEVGLGDEVIDVESEELL